MTFKHIFFITLFFAFASNVFAETADSLRYIELDELNVVSAIKENGVLRQQPASVAVVSSEQMRAKNISSLKGMGSQMANLFIPEYGSRLTSSIYIRGIGSRMNSSAVGLYVDNIPYVDKSSFDFNFYDIERIDMMRGPQGTLYGRNTMGGLLRVFTKNPFNYTGTDLKLGFATGDSHRNVSLTHYHRVSDKFAFSTSGYYEGSNGFFRNITTGEKADGIQSGGGRIRGIFKANDRLSFDLTAAYDYSDEGAYPYFYTGSLTGNEEFAECIGKISNNRESKYRRSMFNAGLNIEYIGKGWMMNAITAYQNLNDRMFMDQDFLVADIYTLEQRQRINTLSEEVVFKSTKQGVWEWLTGVNAMYQGMNTDGPVVFYEDGLRWLEQTINVNMPDVKSIPSLSKMGFQSMGVNLRGNNLLMDSQFKTPVLNLAFFHQSTLNLAPHFSATLGFRLNYEKMSMKYCAPADVDYGFALKAASPASPMNVNLQDLRAELRGYDGKIRNDYFNILPKITLKYDLGNNSNVYLSVAQGHRSGGYNIQMISELLQGAMKNAMMKGIITGVETYMTDLAAKNPMMPASVITSVTNTMKENMPVTDDPAIEQMEFKPEKSWNYELGTHLNFSNAVSRLAIDVSAFYSRIFDQQITRFTNIGMGRMMVNAGRSESYGAELSACYMYKDLMFTGNYGFTNATFLEYEDGKGNDYKDKYVPFVPKNILNLGVAYVLHPRNVFNRKEKFDITLGVDFNGTGRIYWTENNNVSQPFYTTLGAHIAFETKNVSLILWSKNLTQKKYNTFYFESVGRGFEQHCKPIQAGIDLNWKF